MNNLFYSLPLELQFRISEMNPLTIPEDIFNKVMLYNSHPVADLFKQAVKSTVDELNEIIPGDYEYDGEDSRRGDNTSFANHFFHEDGSQSRHVYDYGYMNEAYVDSLNEWNRNNNQNIRVSVF